MGGSSRVWLLLCGWCAGAFLPVHLPTSAAAEVCLFEANQKPPYYVLGSRVQPQSEVLIVGDCSASFDALNRQYARAAQSRLKVGQVTPGAADDCQPNHVFMRGCADTSDQ